MKCTKPPSLVFKNRSPDPSLLNGPSAALMYLHAQSKYGPAFGRGAMHLWLESAYDGRKLSSVSMKLPLSVKGNGYMVLLIFTHRATNLLAHAELRSTNKPLFKMRLWSVTTKSGTIPA